MSRNLLNVSLRDFSAHCLPVLILFPLIRDSVLLPWAVVVLQEALAGALPHTQTCACTDPGSHVDGKRKLQENRTPSPTTGGEARAALLSHSSWSASEGHDFSQGPGTAGNRGMEIKYQPGGCHSLHQQTVGASEFVMLPIVYMHVYVQTPMSICN